MAATYWIKLYHEILHDRKMATLSDHLYRRAIELFLLAGQQNENGALPSLEDMAWTLRSDEDVMLNDLNELIKIGICDKRGDVWWVTNFAERQAPADADERKTHYKARQVKTKYYNDETLDKAPAQTENIIGTKVERNVPVCGTETERNVPVCGTNPGQNRIDTDKIRIDTDKIRSESAHNSDLAQAQSAPADSPLTLITYPHLGKSDKPPEFREDIPGETANVRDKIAYANNLWSKIGGQTSSHNEDIYWIGNMVKTYGQEAVLNGILSLKGKKPVIEDLMHILILPESQPAPPALAAEGGG